MSTSKISLLNNGNSCRMSWTNSNKSDCYHSKKNRSGVPYLKNEMPRVLLPGESDATTQQEREECIQAFRDAADHVLSRHHRAFLGAFKQMMVAVFGPGMEQAFNKTPIQGGTVEMGESSSQPPLQGQPAQPPPQSAGSQAIEKEADRPGYPEAETQ
jgi:hypothetical protein